ncbi:MAG: signal peptidase I [Lachnospiraceae bacterium]|nr:signal peptidase I [Lachnospiraceae bacterium]MDY4971881.1 signal peptidase I [Lachnospiraceae bacterium]
MSKESVKEWIIYILAVIIISFCIVTFVGQRTVVDGHSMNDTLQDKDNLIVDKLSYRFTDIDRFDIVVFKYHEDPKTYFIKRVIGLPGETVQIIGDDIYIDGEILEEDYGKEPMESPGRASEPITLGEDEYFVLGDNRNDSRDSRDPSVGDVERDAIIGRALFRITPFNKAGLLLDR